MTLIRFNADRLRNLQAVALQPSPRVNLLHGANGSGKTSLLEAIHLLGLARSFRSTKLAPVIQHEQASCTVFGQVRLPGGQDCNLGIQRERGGDYQIRINGENARSAAQLAEVLPLQLINPDGLRLLEGSPKIRRQFLDWGVFHEEQRFLPLWQRLQKALRQRNHWLRRGKIDPAAQAAWDQELALASGEIDGFRQAYIQRLKPEFTAVLAELIQLDGLTLSYYRGWDRERDLREVLADSLPRDLQLGHTQAGPQRADLRIRIGNHNAADILSRGQQKLVVCALRIAQGRLVNQVKRGQCVYLIDDLPSELDEGHRLALCRLLEALECQVFITCVERETLQAAWRPETEVSVFHVEHGHIKQTHTSGSQA